MKLLVLASEPITAEALRSALPDSVDPTDSEVMVVAPAVQERGLRFWMSDADDAIAEADKVRRESVDRLGQEGIPASGDTGESDPMLAIQDALTTFDADRIVVFAHQESDEGYREDIDPAEIEERFGRPVDRATASG
jgi:hypothetical protein